MKERQVLTITEMLHLLELGVDTSDASFYIISTEGVENVYFGEPEGVNGIRTYTYLDLQLKLPEEIVVDGTVCYFRDENDCVGYDYYDEEEHTYFPIIYVRKFEEDNCPIRAIYKLYCWYVKNFEGSKRLHR